MKNKILFSIIFLVSVLFAINAVSAATYHIQCFSRGQIMPPSTACNYDCCNPCMTESGYTTAPQYCAGLPDCTCTNNTEPAYAYFNATEINRKISALENKTIALEGNVTLMSQKIKTLESNITIIQSLIASLQANINNLQTAINAIQTSINSILFRLTALESNPPVNNQTNSTPVGCAYSNPDCGTGYQCVNNNCVIISTCTENWQCSIWTACQPNSQQIRTCGDLNSCGTITSKPAELQACAFINKTVTFRTNVVNKNYGSSTGEIVFDYNYDGSLDCFKYSSFYANYFNSFPTILGKTVEGYDIIKYTKTQVIIRYGSNYIYDLSNNCATPLSKMPTEPYATNNQERYN